VTPPRHADAALPDPMTDRLADELLAVARPLAESVGQHLVEALASTRTIVTKSTSTDLVTEMDTWAERTLVDGLLAARPDDGILGEEGADIAGTSGVVWSIDPIDGTVNFVHGMPGFNVSMGARIDGETVAAVVVSPLHRDTFTATLGGGAARNDEPIRCSELTDLRRAVVGTGFGYDPARRRRQADVLAAVIPQVADVRRVGAAALDLCWVACGRLDAYWEVGLNDWDHAAGALIATEAGAICTDLDGGAVTVAFAMAAPPALAGPLRSVLHAADAAAV